MLEVCFDCEDCGQFTKEMEDETTQTMCKCGKTAWNVKDGVWVFDKEKQRMVPKNRYVNKETGNPSWRMGIADKDGAYIYENGKKKLLNSRRSINEYAKRNDFVVGGDDLEQEAARNKINNEKAIVDRQTDKVMEKFKYMQFVKSQNKSRNN